MWINLFCCFFLLFNLSTPYWRKPRRFRLFFVLTIVFVFNPKVLYDNYRGIKRENTGAFFTEESHLNSYVWCVCCEKGQKKKPLTVKLIPSTEPIAKHLSPTLQAPLNIWWQSIMWPWKCVHLRTSERECVCLCVCLNVCECGRV